MENVMKERPYICAAKLHNIKMFVEYWILYLLCNAILIFYGPSLDGIVVPRGFPKESDSTWRATFEKFAMSAPVPLGSGFDAALPRKPARISREFWPVGSRSRREPRIFSTR
jgi:hypothetical protein